jgi:hypothetical protein
MIDNINKLRSQKKGLDLLLNSAQAQDPHNVQLVSPDSQLPRSSHCTNAESRVKGKKHFAVGNKTTIGLGYFSQKTQYLKQVCKNLASCTCQQNVETNRAKFV